MIPDINLLPKLEKQQTTSKLFYLILAAATLLALAFFAWQYFSASSSISSLQAQEANLIQHRDQLQMGLTDMTANQQTSFEDTVEYLDVISYPVLPLINEIEKLKMNNSYLRNYSFGVDTVTISMDFETLSDISKYLNRLKNSAYFVDVQISYVSQFKLGNETETEETEEDFNVQPRQSANITLTIDEIYLATGGTR
ncbi:Tfp pilus assembly protein PilN OS=Ureibacillus acetophenoni OX=614649 GN=SAMN05877842_10472 PE=4 SV=1 [Ureibacillus acetophenoni]